MRYKKLGAVLAALLIAAGTIAPTAIYASEPVNVEYTEGMTESEPDREEATESMTESAAGTQENAAEAAQGTAQNAVQGAEQQENAGTSENMTEAVTGSTEQTPGNAAEKEEDTEAAWQEQTDAAGTTDNAGETAEDPTGSANQAQEDAAGELTDTTESTSEDVSEPPEDAGGSLCVILDDVQIRVSQPKGERFTLGTTLSVKTAAQAFAGEEDGLREAWEKRLQNAWEERLKAPVSALYAYELTFHGADGEALEFSKLPIEIELRQEEACALAEKAGVCAALGCYAEEQEEIGETAKCEIRRNAEKKSVIAAGTMGTSGWLALVFYEAAEIEEEAAELTGAADDGQNAQAETEERTTESEAAETETESETESESESAATEEDAAMMELAAKSEKKTVSLDNLGTGYTLPSDWKLGFCGTTHRVVRYRVNGKTKESMAYCIQPKKGQPQEGERDLNDSGDVAKLSTSDKWKGRMLKGLYFLYGGPAWNQTVPYADGSGSVNFKSRLKEFGCSSKGEYFAATHYILSYCYAKGDEDKYDGSYNQGVHENTLSQTGKKHIKAIVAELDKVEFENASFSVSELTGTYDAASGASVTGQTTYRAGSGNDLTLTLGEGVTLVNDTSGTTQTGQAVIHPQETFHLVCARGAAMGHASYQAVTKFGTDFAGYYSKEEDSRQNIAFGYTTGEPELTLTADWPEYGWLEIQKKDADTKRAQAHNCAVTFAGAQYTIYEDSGCTRAAQTLTLDAAGYAKSGMLPPGVYYIKETRAPIGYQLNPQVYETQAQGGMTIKTETEDGVVRGSVMLMKYLDSQEVEPSKLQDLYDSGELEGITFTLTHEDWANVSQERKEEFQKIITTDRFGRAKTEPNSMPYGTWKVTESNTPPGYEGIKEKEIQITKNGVESAYVVSNIETFAFVKILKLDALTGEAIPRMGASFRILDESGNPVFMRGNLDTSEITDVFTTNDKGEILLTDPLRAGNYRLQEIEAPEGFLTAEEIAFTVSETHDLTDPLVVRCEDAPQMGRVRVQKTDAAGAPLGEGVTFELVTAEDILDTQGKLRTMEIDGEETELKTGTRVDILVTDENGIAQSREVFPGNYHLIETTSAQYYAVELEPYALELRWEEQKESFLVETEIANEKTNCRILKYDALEDQVLAGVTFRIVASTELEAWEAEHETTADMQQAMKELGNEYVTDENGCIELTDLTHGTSYYVFETKTLPGYQLDETVHGFVVDERGLIDGQSSYELKLTNIPNVMEISKRAITGSEELPGATLTLAKEDGTEIETWVSGTEPKRIVALEAGKYVLTEEIAPNGYRLAESIAFELTDSLEVKQVTMYDAPLELSISKQDITTKEELPGAELTIRNEEGKIVDQWISTSRPHSVILTPGRYRLTEVTAPKKYATAETIEFEVDEHLTTEHVVMYDAPLEVSISKQDITTKKELPGAKLVLKDEDGVVVESWTSTDKPHRLCLEKGTYELTEKIAPFGYETAESITFAVKDTLEVQKVTMYDTPKAKASVKEPGASGGSWVRPLKTGLENRAGWLFGAAALCMLGAWACIRRLQKNNK